MSEVRIYNRCSLLISQKIEKEDIINFIERKLNKVVVSSMGGQNCYSLNIKDREGNYVAAVDVSINKVHNIYITIITEKVESKEIYGKEVYERDIQILDSFANAYPGIIHIDKSKSGGCSESGYIINYDKDSTEYKLIELLIDDIGIADKVFSNTDKVLATMQLLKNKKEDLLEIIK